MSTRGCFRFHGERHTLTIYKHSDCYPHGPWGGVAAIAKALPHAWRLPRFEAGEFAAAFVAAHKRSAQDLAYDMEWQAAAEPDVERAADLRRDAAELRIPDSRRSMGLGGEVRVLNTPNATTLEHIPGDCQFLYDVTCQKGKLHVKVSRLGETPDGQLIAEKLAAGPLDKMLVHFKEKVES